jgi:hypothetical protein
MLAFVSVEGSDSEGIAGGPLEGDMTGCGMVVFRL